MKRHTIEALLVTAVFGGAFTWFSACGDDTGGGGDAGGTPGDCDVVASVGTGPVIGEPGAGGNPPVVGGEGNTFDHFAEPGSSGKDPFETLKELTEEGPPEIRTRLHSCSKISYGTLGRMLVAFGVDLTSSGDPRTAGQIHRLGADSLGAPQYPSREGEKAFHTTSGAARLFDIFVQAAPEIIAAMPTLPQCQLNGQGFDMFTTSPEGAVTCTPEALSCLIGRIATPQDVALCDLVLAAAEPGDAGDLVIKQHIAVATALSAAHTCE